jgi:hypothetical protein
MVGANDCKCSRELRLTVPSETRHPSLLSKDIKENNGKVNGYFDETKLNRFKYVDDKVTDDKSL